MPVVVVRLPDSTATPEERPDKCPYCHSQILQGWGLAPRSIQDIQPTSAEIHRYRCSDCGRTFRHYPQGVDRNAQTLRVRKLAALAWVMGISSRDVVDLFRNLGIELNRMTVWREGKELARQLQERASPELWKKYTLDPVYLPGVSPRFGVVLVLDVGLEKRIVLGTMDEYNPRKVKSWLEQLAPGFDFQVSVVTTDFLTLSRPLALQSGTPSK